MQDQDHMIVISKFKVNNETLAQLRPSVTTSFHCSESSTFVPRNSTYLAGDTREANLIMGNLEANLSKSIRFKNSNLLCQLISISSGDSVSSTDATTEKDFIDGFSRVLDRRLSKQDRQLWINLGIIIFNAQSSKSTNFKTQVTLLSSINRVAERLDKWILPVVYKAAFDLFKMAETPTSTSTVKDNLEEASRIINKSLVLCLNDRTNSLDKSRKHGTYFFAALLLKVYKKLGGNTALASSLVKVLEQQHRLKTLEDPTWFPKAHVISVYYHASLVHVSAREYDKARNKLQTALTLLNSCPASEKLCLRKNKQLILLYLIPLEISFSRKTPSGQLWEQFPDIAKVYQGLVNALMSGNFKCFDDQMLQNRRFLIKNHLYLLWSEVRVLIYGRLFRKVYEIRERSNRIPTWDFANAWAYSNHRESAILPTALSTDEISDDNKNKLDQTECYLTHAIYHGFMKGYISRERRTIVLSNREAFPKVEKYIKGTEIIINLD